MLVDARRVWLTRQAYDRVRAELAQLLAERDTGSHRSYDDDGQRELRIRHLQELVSTVAVGHEPPDDGVAEPGMVLTVHYETAGFTETFLLAHREESTQDGDLPICSPRSPLGMALTGAGRGERREYQVPSGDTVRVTLLDAVPYGSRAARAHDADPSF